MPTTKKPEVSLLSIRENSELNRQSNSRKKQTIKVAAHERLAPMHWLSGRWRQTARWNRLGAIVNALASDSDTLGTSAYDRQMAARTVALLEDTFAAARKKK